MDFPILYSIHGDQKVFPTLCKFLICEGEGFGPPNRSTQGQHRNGRRGQWPTVLCGCYRSSPKRANWGKGRPTCVSVCAFLIAWWSENTANKKKPLYCLSVSCAYVFSFSLSAKLLYSRRESRRRPDNTQQSLSWQQCLRAPRVCAGKRKLEMEEIKYTWVNLTWNPLRRVGKKRRRRIYCVEIPRVIYTL